LSLNNSKGQMRQASVHSGSSHCGVRPAWPRWPSPLGPFRPEAQSRGNRRLVDQFRSAHSRLLGKIGLTSLSKLRGILLGGSDGEGAHRSMATTAMAVEHWGAPVRARRSGLSQSWSGCRSTPRRGGAHGGRDGLGDAWMACCR
jgi:hypothetical protein